MSDQFERQLARIRKRFEAIPKGVRDAVKPALLRSGNELADLMKHMAPQDTGALKDSITVTPGGETTPPYSQPGASTVVSGTAIAVTAGNSEVRYAHLQEYGTAHASAHPFFWPATRLLRKRMTNRIKRAVAKAVRESGK